MPSSVCRTEAISFSTVLVITNQTTRLRDQQKHNMNLSKPDLKPDMLSILHVKTTGNGSSLENPSLIPLLQLRIALTKKPYNGRLIEKRTLGQMTAEQALVVVSNSLPPSFRWHNGKYKVCQNNCFVRFIRLVSICVSSFFCVNSFHISEQTRICIICTRSKFYTLSHGGPLDITGKVKQKFSFGRT